MTTMDIKRGYASLAVGLLRYPVSCKIALSFRDHAHIGPYPHPKNSEKFRVP